MRRTRPDLQKSMEEKGFDPKYPIQLKFGKDGHVKIEEGNHRLKTAIQLKLDKVPVVFNFGDTAIKHPIARDIAQMRIDKELARKKGKEAERTAFDRKYGLDKAREKAKEKERQRLASLSPEQRQREEEEKQATVDELMDLLGFQSFIKKEYLESAFKKLANTQDITIIKDWEEIMDIIGKFPNDITVMVGDEKKYDDYLE